MKAGTQPRIGLFTLMVPVSIAVAGLTLTDAAQAQRGRQQAAPAAAQITCPEGVVTALGREANDAQRLLLLNRVDQAYPQAQAAVQKEPNNPRNQLLLGQLEARRGRGAEATAAFNRAVELCPGIQEETRTARLEAWGQAFQRGVEAFGKGDTTAALAQWDAANAVYDARPDAYYNIGVVRSQQKRFADAAVAYRRALEVLSKMPADTSAAEMTGRAETRTNAVAGLSVIGAQLFQQQQYEEARAIFAQLGEIDPNNRDVWYNHSLALYRLERWNDLLPVASKVVEIDPLNYNARIILFNAYKGGAEAATAARDTARARTLRNQTVATLTAADALPIQLDEIRLETRDDGTVQVRGTAIGAKAPAGQPVQLVFTLYGNGGSTRTKEVSIPAPATDQSAPFSFEVPGGAAYSFSYVVRQ